MQFTVHNTLPDKDKNYWQIDILPSLSFLRSNQLEPDKDEKLLGWTPIPGYTCISLQWLFWSITVMINDKQ